MARKPPPRDVQQQRERESSEFSSPVLASSSYFKPRANCDSYFRVCILRRPPRELYSRVPSPFAHFVAPLVRFDSTAISIHSFSTSSSRREILTA